MSNVVVPLETDPHQAVLALLPWYSRERLSGEEMSLVREHLQHCAACRSELEAERSLQAALADSREEPALNTEAALHRMRRLMNEQAPEKAKRGWMPWALGLQGVAIVALVFVVARPAPEALAPYKGLSAAGMPAETVHAETIVMFRPGVDEAGIRKALLAHRAQVVGGPTESGAYRLHLPGGAPALAALRAEPVVSLAESLDPPPPPAQP
ncbi:zf-HC2 domain-containing protein [Paucibacter sp. R3-3]|uniref:Zf-HC2 domain-containing protein n=1 Tax=Roseateles agri TaxID=3098619 RepID=A0ABU5DR40_9BURK|nr:zf-HC2 domain-containing protein [Paucibacter sp. R3-3]MDY0748783.1 zf-HC2 domain-containing protein [Paucibacter sp. R3-3]